MPIGNSILRAMGIGAMSGMRSFSVPAWIASSGPIGGHSLVRTLALLELAADKLPQTPNRTAPLSMAFRAGVGAVSAGLLDRQENAEGNNGEIKAAIVSAASALGVAYVNSQLRKVASRKLPAGNVISGIAEDIAVFALKKFVLGKKSIRSKSEKVPVFAD